MKKYISDEHLQFWYQTPGELWTDALPIGNGRLGAMVYGRGKKEQIQIDENTFWSGCPSEENDLPQTREVLERLREALRKPDYEAADQIGKAFVGKKGLYGTNMPVGNLCLEVLKAEKREEMPEREQIFRRSLSLRTGIAENDFSVNGVRFHREVLTSNPDQVFALHMEADGVFSMKISYKGIDNNTLLRGSLETENGQRLGHIQGDAFETLHSDGKTGVHLEGAVSVIADGTINWTEDGALIEDCTCFTLFLDLETTMFFTDPRKRAMERAQAAAQKGYDAVKEAHIADVSVLFDRLSLYLGEEEAAALPTDERLRRAIAGKGDTAFYALLFQYGRYLLIASSREDSLLPTHMGGIWNDNIYNKLDCAQDMHIDMNLEMQYWLASQCALPECYAPFFDYVEKVLMPNGKKTAAVTYGAEGFCAGVISNPWGFTALGWSYNWGVFALGGAWCATMAWDSYTYSGDLSWLETRGMPIIEEAAAFAADYCFFDESRDIYQCGPSYSPENMFRSDGKDYFLSLSTTCDVILVREILTVYQKACALMKPERAGLPERAKEILEKLPPYQIGKDGRLQEWLADVEDAIPNHRHTSHLLGLYPFRQIVPEKEPALAMAAIKSIERRHENFEITSWGLNMLMGYYARLGDGDAGMAILQEILELIVKNNLSSIMSNGESMWMGEWELDGNTGLTASFLEFFVQSFEDETILLPALPERFLNGVLKGVSLRGGHSLDLSWRDGKVEEAVIHAGADGSIHIRTDGETLRIPLKKGETVRV